MSKGIISERERKIAPSALRFPFGSKRDRVDIVQDGPTDRSFEQLERERERERSLRQKPPKMCLVSSESGAFGVSRVLFDETRPLLLSESLSHNSLTCSEKGSRPACSRNARRVHTDLSGEACVRRTVHSDFQSFETLESIKGGQRDLTQRDERLGRSIEHVLASNSSSRPVSKFNGLFQRQYSNAARNPRELARGVRHRAPGPARDLFVP